MTAEVQLIKTRASTMRPGDKPRTVVIAKVKAGKVTGTVERYTECIEEGRYYVNHDALIDVKEDVGVGMAQVHLNQDKWQHLLDLAAVATACASILKPLNGGTR